MALAGAVAGFFFGRWYNDNKRPNFTERYVLFVRPDTPVQTVIDSLVNGAGALRPRSLERCFEKEGLSDEMKPGRYIIEPSFTSIYVARMLLFGWQTPGNLTLSGTIRTKERLAKKIAVQMMADSTSIADALNSKDFLAKYLP